MARVMIFNGSDWEPLDWEVPATAGGVTVRLNHSTMTTLTVPAEYNRFHHDGFPRIYKNMTNIAVEDDDGRLFAGVVKESPLGGNLQVVAHGHSVLSKDFPWHGDKRSWQDADGIGVFRDVWQHIIENGGFDRLEITGATTGGSNVGVGPSPAWQNLDQQIEAAEVFVNRRENRVDYWERQLNNRTRDLYQVSGRKQVGEIAVANDPPGISDVATYKGVIEIDDDGRVVAVHFWEWQGVGGGTWLRFSGPNTLEAARNWRATEASLGRAKELYPTYVQRAEDLRKIQQDRYAHGEPEPYELTWWDARDLSTNLEEIRELGDFSWHDDARWDGDRPVPQIRVLKDDRPVREDIHLEFGVNVIDVDDLVPGDSATHITVLGAGEGTGTIKAERRSGHDRMVPVYRTISDKDLRTKQLAEKAADKERNRARKALEPMFRTLQVVDHALAPISSFQVGNRVRVVGELSDGTDHEGIMQVTSIQRDLGGKTIGVEVEHE